MSKTRPIYGRLTRGLKPHEAPKGYGFTPDLWNKVNVSGKPILIEHDWRNPGPVGTFVRNWVEHDENTGEHWCCIEGELDMEGPHGERVISDIKAGKYPAWSVSLIQSNPELVNDVGNNREFLEGSLTNDPAETGTQVLVRHNGKGDPVPVTAVPMSVSLEPTKLAAPKTEAAVTGAASVQPVETQQKAPDTLTKQEGQPLAPGADTLSLAATPVPHTGMADSLAKTAAGDGQQQQNATPGTTDAPKTTTTTTSNSAKVNLAPPKKAAETEKKEVPKKATPPPKEDEIMKESEVEEKEEEEEEEEVEIHSTIEST